MADTNVNLKITGDASGASAAVDQARAKFDQLGASARAAMQSGSAAINAQRDAVGQLIAQIDPLAGKFAKLDEQLSALKAFKASGAISGEDFAAYAAKIEETRVALGGVEGAAAAAGKSFAGLAMNSRVAYSASALLSDALSGQFGRSKREVAALANETGLLGKTFSALAGPVGAVVAVVATLGAAYIAAEREQSAFSQALNVTGNYVGQTVDGLEAMKNAIGSADADYGKAATALTALAGSGKIAGDNLQLAAQAAVDFSNVTGESIEKSTAVIEKLAANPTQAVEKLNESFHFLTLAEYENIAALQKAGDTDAAFAVAAQALDAAMKQRAAQAQADAGLFSRAWHGAIDTVATDWNTLKTLMGSIGNNSLEQKLQNELQTYTAMTSMVDANTAAGRRAIAMEEQKIQALERDIQAQNHALTAQSAYEKVQQQGITADAELTKFLDQHAQKSEKLSGDLQILQGMLVKVAAAAAATAAKNGTFSGWVDAFSQLKTLAEKASQGVADLDSKYNKAAKSIDYAAQDQQLLNSILDKAAQSVQKVDDLFDQYSSGLGGPWVAALNKYNKTLSDLDTAYQGIQTQLNLGVISQDEYDKKLSEFIDVSELAGQALDDQQQKIIETTDILGNFDQQTQYEIDALQQSGVQHEIYTALLRAENEARKLYNEGLRETPQLYQYEIDGITQDVEAHHNLEVAVKASQDALKAWGDVAKNAFDGATSDFSKWVVEGGSFMSSLKDTAKQTVEAIITQFARLELLGPFMHALFGDAANAMGYSAAGMSGMQGMGGLVGSLFGGGGSFGGSGSIVGTVAQDFLGGGSGGSSGGLFSVDNLFSAGKTIFSGFQSGFSTITNGAGNLSASLFGTETYTPGIMGPPSDLANGFMGPSSSLAGNSALGYGGYGSALGQGLGIAGGIYAGYNEYNAAGGGVAGLAGGAAYGVGTYFAGAAVTSALSGGIAAGMAAIPVVGWIALAAMAINMISGGKLFGTAASPTGGDLTETIGPGGATLTNILHEKGQKALFGGAYYKNVNEPVDPQAQAAADAFFAALQKGTNDFASSFGTTLTTIVGGSFDQKYDKNGKPTTSSDTVLGVTYAGETQAQFASRIQAENYIAVLDKLGVNATAYSQAFIGNADNLLKAIQDLGAASQAAYADINRGMGLLGPSGNLGAVVSEVEKLDQSGETLANAYARLVKEEDAWKGSMEAAVLSLNKSSTATLEFADSLSKAFGSDSAMQQALQAFDKNFYSSGQGAALKIANDQSQLGILGAQIGQSPTETAAQFFSAFRQVESTLSPDQLAKWINFGNLLAQVNGEVASAASSYAQFMAQFAPAASGFEQAMQKVSDTLASNIAQANNLAQANGAAGASAQDIGKIISASVMQGVQAVRALETEAANLSQTLFGGDLASQIAKVKAEADAGNQVAAAQLFGLLQQQSQQQAAAAKQQQFLQAAQLLGDLGQIGAVTGQGLGDFAKMFNIPLDKFASILGTDQSGLKAGFAKQEDMAKSALETASNTKYSNELQADILAALQGTAAPFSTAELYAALTGTEISNPAAPGGKNGARGATGGPTTNDTATAVQTGTQPVVSATKSQTQTLGAKLDDIKQLLRELKNNGYQGGPRSTRAPIPYIPVMPQ